MTLILCAMVEAWPLDGIRDFDKNLLAQEDRQDRNRHMGLRVQTSPQASMQYTASSFAAPIIDYFKVPLAAARKSFRCRRGFFPEEKGWSFHSVRGRLVSHPACTHRR